MSNNPDWLDIPRLEFEIRGVKGSSIQFASEAVLAKRVVSTGIVSFEALLTLPTTNATFQHSFRFADYGGLRRFRDGLSAIRSGTGTLDGRARLAGNGFSLEVYVFGVGESLLVQGYCSSIYDLRHAPWPATQRISDLALLDSSTAGCIQFAFLSSIVDPPYVDNAVTGLDTIIRFLEDEGFQP